MQQRFMSVGNKLISWLLRSPFHGFVSRNMALLTVTGKVTGKTYQLPVNYQKSADTVWLTSFKYRNWWKNLRNGAPVVIRIQGVDFHGQATVHETPSGVIDGLKAYFDLAPEAARYFSVSLDSESNPDPADLARIVPGRVVIEIMLT